MNSTVRFTIEETGEEFSLSLVYPKDAGEAGRISVLAPLGTALLGYRQGDVVERVMPGGLRRLLVEEVLQQPAMDGVAAGATQGAESGHWSYVGGE